LNWNGTRPSLIDTNGELGKILHRVVGSEKKMIPPNSWLPVGEEKGQVIVCVRSAAKKKKKSEPLLR